MKKMIWIMLVAVYAIPNVMAFNPDDVLGVWLVQDKDAKIELYKTKDGELRGKCIWHKIPGLKDVDNKDPNERDKPVVGKIFVWGFHWNAEDGIWDGGKVYKQGKTYCGKIKLNPDGTLYLKGNICNTFLGKTNTWTRVK